MYKIAALGDYDSIYGFKTLGLSTFPVSDPDEGEKTLKSLVDNGFAVIYITESLATGMGKIMEKYRESITPAIILIPGISGNTGEGVKGVSKSVEQAVGSDILFSNP